MSIIKEILNILYLISGIVIAVVSILALKQISIAKTQMEIAKNSIEISSQRDAAVFTAKQCEYFATEILRDFQNILDIFKSKGIEKCKLPSDKTKIFDIDYSLWINKNDGIFRAENLKIYGLITDSINKLEAFSIYFTQGICDTKIAYLPVANTYTEVLEVYCPFICYVRNKDRNGYANIVKLYEIWIAELIADELKFKKDELQKQIALTEEQASAIKDVKITPIGTKYNGNK